MSKKLYVGNMASDTTSSQLQDMFGQYGEVRSAQVVTHRDSGQSKGFGFVEMAADADAEKAITGLNGQTFDGRSLTVNEAKAKESRPRTGGSDGLSGGSGPR